MRVVCAVDVEVVGVGGGDDAHPRAEVVEGAVELVGLNHRVGAVGREQQVGAIVFRDASQEGRAAHVRLVQQVGGHGAGGGLAVGACHAEAFAAARDEAQHLGALVYLEATGAEVGQFGMLLRDGGGVDYQRGGGVAARVGDEGGVFLVVYLCAFGREALGQRGGGAVVAGHGFAFRQEVAHQGAHADASRADEVNGLYVG